MEKLTLYPGDLGLLSATAWLIDRTVEENEIIGTAWMPRDGEVVTCASLVLPFGENPDSLAVEFPATRERFGVKEFRFHNLFDRWKGKRELQESRFYPHFGLTASPYNVAGIKLTRNLKNLGRDTMTRLKNKITYHRLDEEPDLTGQAENLQFVSILQTLMNARNIGTMMLVDNLNRVVARVCLGDQRVTHIQYQNLVNEEALNKMICTLDQELKFYFKRELDPAWANFPPIEKSTAAILMNAYQVLEESSALYQGVGGKTVEICRTKDELSLLNLTEAQCPPVACVWNHIKFPVPISRVVRGCSFDGAIVLHALKYLVDTGQAQVGNFELPALNEIRSINLADDLTITSGQEVYSFSVDASNRKSAVDMGYIINPLENDAGTQYIHSLGLPMESIGAPIVANDRVIGIHSGWLIDGFENYKEWIHPGIMIGAEAIYDCLEIRKPGQALVSGDYKTVTLEEETLFEIKAVDLNERLTEEITEEETETSVELEEEKTAPAPVVESAPVKQGRKDPRKLSGFFKSVAGMLSSIGTSGEGLEVNLYRQSLASERYEKIPPDTSLLIGDFIQLRIKVLSDCQVVVFFQAGPEQPLELLYPTQDLSGEVEKGEHITIPTEPISIVSAGVMQTYSGFPLNFREQETELIVAFAFDSVLDGFDDSDQGEALKAALFQALAGSKNLEFKKYELDSNATSLQLCQKQTVDKTESGKLFACHLSVKL
ncbi:MAG: hypothetical protein H6677_14375 [Candidatus Obscuribacterales bacterium]|nr:hypothetical protein [Candidatus Obscuribacterales bacterium]